LHPPITPSTKLDSPKVPFLNFRYDLTRDRTQPTSFLVSCSTSCSPEKKR